MGRTTFLTALTAPRWPWTQPVFVLTSSALPDDTPSDVRSAPTAGELVKLMESAGIGGDVHLVGGPKTMQAFREIRALAEVWLHVVAMILGSGHPLDLTDQSRYTSRSSRHGTFRTASSSSDTSSSLRPRSTIAETKRSNAKTRARSRASERPALR
jgi:dihydrofolate reductase